MEATNPYQDFQDHAATFPKDNRLINIALRIPVIQIAAYEILLYQYQDNPLAHDHLSLLKNRVKQNITDFFGLTSFACLAVAGLSATTDLELPKWTAHTVMAISGITFAHYIGRNFLHKEWNYGEVNNTEGSKLIYTRGDKKYIFETRAGTTS